MNLAKATESYSIPLSSNKTTKSLLLSIEMIKLESAFLIASTLPLDSIDLGELIVINSKLQ